MASRAAPIPKSAPPAGDDTTRLLEYRSDGIYWQGKRIEDLETVPGL